MGLFSSKKKTFSGVGSAIQNLWNGDDTPMLTSTVVTAQVNQKDLGDTFLETLKTGSGMRLRNAIDYAKRSGYNNIIGWDSTYLKGEVFSNSNDYTRYLLDHVYPSTNVHTESLPEIVNESTPRESFYHLGDDRITTKRFTRTKRKILSDENVIQNVDVNTYYQGSDRMWYLTNKILNSERANLVPYFEDEAYTIRENLDAVQYGSHKVRRYDEDDGWTTGNVDTTGFYTSRLAHPITLILLPSSSSLPLDNSSCAYFALKSASDQKLTSWNGSVNSDGKRVYEYIYGGDFIGTKVEMLERLRGSVNRNPIGSFNLNSTEPAIITTNIGICLRTYSVSIYETRKSPDGHEYQELKSISPSATWFFGKAIILIGAETNTQKSIFADIDITTTKTKTTTVIETDYAVTERYRNDVLIDSYEVTGASHTEPTVDYSTTDKIKHTENYLYKSGNSHLDTILENTKSFAESFAPTMPIKAWGNMASASWGNVWDAERHFYRKLTNGKLGDWSKFVDSFKSVGDDGKFITYWLGIPINIDTDATNEYFYHFFKWIAVNFGGMIAGGRPMHLIFRSRAGHDFQAEYKFRVAYSLIHGKCPVSCKVHGYARRVQIGWSEPDCDQTSDQWQGDFNDGSGLYYMSSGAYDSAYTVTFENSAERLSESFNILNPDFSKTKLTFYHKINDDLYEKIYVTDCLFQYLVRGHYLRHYLRNSLTKNFREETLEDIHSATGFAPIFIPIARGALESMGWYRQSNILQYCSNVIITGYQQETIKVKWYKAILPIFLIVVAIVIVVCTWGYGAPAAGSVAGAGGTAAGASTTATMTAIATAVGKAIAIAVVCKAISYAANKFIGGTAGQVIGAIGSIVATVYMSYQFGWIGNVDQGESLWSAMNTWKGYSTIGQAVAKEASNISQARLQNKANVLAEDYAEYRADASKKQQEILLMQEQMNAWLGNKQITNIIGNSSYTSSTQPVRAEDPDTFFTRVMSLDFYELNKSYVADFEDYMNNLKLPS